MDGDDKALTLFAARPDGLPQVKRGRGDGWTADRQRIFFGCMRATCNVRFSAGEAGMSHSGCYAKRRTDPDFAAEWREAMADGYVRMETMLIARACGTDDAAALKTQAEAERAGDAETAERMIALTESLDSQLALQLMASHRKTVHGGVRAGGGVSAAKVEADAVDAAILKQLAALARHRGGPA